jgi:hypothetical protein
MGALCQAVHQAVLKNATQTPNALLDIAYFANKLLKIKLLFN